MPFCVPRGLQSMVIRAFIGGEIEAPTVAGWDPTSGCASGVDQVG